MGMSDPYDYRNGFDSDRDRFDGWGDPDCDDPDYDYFDDEFDD